MFVRTYNVVSSTLGTAYLAQHTWHSTVGTAYLAQHTWHSTVGTAQLAQHTWPVLMALSPVCTAMHTDS